jgi:hypothetical protein
MLTARNQQLVNQQSQRSKIFHIYTDQAEAVLEGVGGKQLERGVISVLWALRP